MKKTLEIDELEPIEIHSFQQQVIQPVAAASGTGGRTGGRCDFLDITIEKDIDKNTPVLFLHCCSGKWLPKMEFKLPSEKYTLSILINNVILSSQLISSNNKEVLTVAYGKIKLTYDDHEKSKISTAWNLETNTPE